MEMTWFYECTNIVANGVEGRVHKMHSPMLSASLQEEDGKANLFRSCSFIVHLGR